jgi:hypothetical protein
VGGDAWGAGEPPLGEAGEQYLVEILNGDQVRRSAYPVSAAYLYDAADQIADFGYLPGSLRIRVAQVAGSGLPGLKTELTITL